MNTTTSPALLAIYLVVTLIAALPLILFVARYWWTTRGAWRDSHMGKSLMFLNASLASVLLFIAFNTAWTLIAGQSYALRVPIGIALYATLSLSFWRQWWSFEKINNDSKEEDR